MALAPGELYASRFRVERLAAEGGMGIVYEARDEATDERVALKVLTAGQSAERFEREALVLARLRHPSIVRYVAHGRAGDDVYLVMEWLAADDLAARLARGPLALLEAIALGKRVAQALAVAHAAGVVHRDIKPANILLPNGDVERAVLADFGIAFAEEHEDETRITHAGTLIGTPAYMAPEQARADPRIDHRADLFSLGVLIFESLAGRPPFRAETAMGVLAKVLLEDAPRVSTLRDDVPAELDELVANLLAKHPADRPRDASVVLAALARVPIAVALAAPRSAPTSGLTRNEQRLVSIVMARGALEALAEADRTIDAVTATRLWAELGGAADTLGAKVDRLADGTILASVVDARTATDQARRVARTSLRLRAILPRAQIVATTGRALAGADSVVGDVIDRAVRLIRAKAASYAVAIDEVTAGLLDASFDVSGDPGDTLALVAERTTEEAPRTLLGKATPFVGRQRELAALVGAFEHAVDEPLASAVIVKGPPGIGKSRLRYELVRQVLKLDATVQVWSARGDALGTGSPFGLLAQLLTCAASLGESDALAVRQKKLRGRVARHVAPGEVARVAGFLGELARTPFTASDLPLLEQARRDSVVMGDQLRRAFEDFLRAEATAAPVLIVLEDLHWGDTPSVGALDAALRNLADLPWMIAAFTRPEVEQRFPSLFAERRVEQVLVGELAKGGARKLAREVLPASASDALIDEIVTRAAGNAFYLEELLRAVATKGEHALPESVLAMVEARLDETSAEARRVLRAASVFGEVFWEAGVLALLGGHGKAPAVAAVLDELVRVELVTRRAEGRFGGSKELAFRHSLVREACYAMLTEADLVMGHRLAADWLVRAGERDALVLAEHFERGGVPANAAGWYRNAASQALEGNDYKGAIRCAERGIACGASGKEAGELRLIETIARHVTGDREGAFASIEQATALLEPGTTTYFRALVERVQLFNATGSLDRVSADVDVILKLAEGGEARPGFLDAAARTARCLLLGGRRELGERILDAVDAHLTNPPPVEDEGYAYLEFTRVSRDLLRGDVSAAAHHCERAIALFDSLARVRASITARCSLGYVYLTLGAYERAEAVLREAVTGTSALGTPSVQANAEHNLGLVLARAGSLAEGAMMEARALERAQSIGDKRTECLARIYLAEIQLAAGATSDALRQIDLALASPGEWQRAAALATRARVLIALGRRAKSAGATLDRDWFADALADATQAMKLVAKDSSYEATAHLALIESLELTGDDARARAELENAHARLLARALALHEDHRRSFLERVPDHKRIVDLAEQRARAR